MATVTGTSSRQDYVPEFPKRLKRFLWLSSGIFSAGALAVAFVGCYFVGAFEEDATNFLASVVYAGIFWISNTSSSGPRPCEP